MACNACFLSQFSFYISDYGIFSFLENSICPLYIVFMSSHSCISIPSMYVLWVASGWSLHLEMYMRLPELCCLVWAGGEACELAFIRCGVACPAPFTFPNQSPHPHPHLRPRLNRHPHRPQPHQPPLHVCHSPRATIFISDYCPGCHFFLFLLSLSLCILDAIIL